MKKILLGIAAVCAALTAQAQTVWHSGDTLALYGKISDATETRYERLPAALKDSVREPVWNLGKNTAGLALRFATNSTSVYVKWETLNNFAMGHMTDRGVKGVDLYCLGDRGWRFVGSAGPGKTGWGERPIIKDMEPTWREFMLYLPLYDGIKQIKIGVDSLSSLSNPTIESPRRGKPIVYYGTSITQGGCANRAGMAHTNIMSRRLDREVINLGFSGNGKLDEPIARLMAEADPEMYIVDCMPNCDTTIVRERFVPFISILREAHPDTPIIVVENPTFSDVYYSTVALAKLQALNAELARQMQHFADDPNIHLLSPGDASGDDWEGTVDCYHLTDLGFQRYADWLLGELAEFFGPR